MPVISFATSKGGAGKTTSAIILGTELAAAGADVILIDADPAENLFDWSEVAPLPKGVEVIKSAGERAIMDEIEDAASRAAFVLIDLEGAATRLASFAIGESDLVIIPSGEEHQDAKKAIETLGEVGREGKTRGKTIPAAVLLCRTNAAVKSRLEKFILADLVKDVPVFGTQLHRRTAYSALHNAGAGLRELDKDEINGVDKAITNAQNFVNEVVEMLEDARAGEAA